jgi:hypothetical protein
MKCSALISSALLSSLLLCTSFANSEAAKEPKVTDKVFFDVEIDGKPAGRVVIGLFGKVRNKNYLSFSRFLLSTLSAGYNNSLNKSSRITCC